MKYNNLGKSGLMVSELSLGSWITFGAQVTDDVAEQLMHTAYDKGVNFFDNAETYAYGESEKVMGRILKKSGWRRDSYIVSSKAFFGEKARANSLPTQKGLSRKHLVEACEQALNRFQLDYLDLFFCHRPDKTVPVVETVWTMHNLIQQGKILYWGTSEWSAAEIMEAHMVARQYNLIGPTMEQPEYNMFKRDKVEVEFSQVYKTVGLGTTVFSPLASGLLTGKYNDALPNDSRFTLEGMEWLQETLKNGKQQKVVELTKLAQEIGTTMPKLAIAWVINNPNVSTCMLGGSKVAHIEETLAASDDVHLLTEEVIEKIEKILDNKPIAPVF